jgi:ABC-2 type transport system permease protein
MVRVVAIARVELLRMLRDRSNLFFVFVFPLLLVVLIGASFGGAGGTRVGVVAPAGDDDAAQLMADIDDADALETVAIDDVEGLRSDVSNGFVTAGVVIPDGYSEALRTGEPVEIGYHARPDTTSMSVRAIVDGIVARQSAGVLAGLTAAEVLDVPLDRMLTFAGAVQGGLPGVTVTTEAVGGDALAQEFEGLQQFDLGASSQLFLFTFLTALTAGVALIRTRQLGVARRMASTPTPIGAIVTGQAAGRVLVALTQAAYIIAATWLLFRVNWGQPLATGVVVVLFGLVAGGAGMLLGATLRNESQAAGVGVGAGLGLAALGGSMVPLEIVPKVMRTVALVTPHAWANRAMAEIVRRDGGLADVVLEVGMLAAFAVALLGLATWQLGRALSR